MIDKLLQLKHRDLVQGVRERIAKRALQAGMEFDPDDLIDHYEDGTTYVFLRRVRHAEYDELGVFITWTYQDLVWAEYRLPQAEKTGDQTFRVTKFQPRVVFRCPWLAARVTDKNEVKWND